MMPIPLQKAPLLTVVIPTCNRLVDLARCLESLSPGRQEGMRYLVNEESGKLKAEIGVAHRLPPSLNAPDAVSDQFTTHSLLPSYHVLITDDGSDLTAMEMIQTRFPWAEWTEGPRRGPAANRNHGARVATGEWVAFIDDDCTASPAWLTAIAGRAVISSVDVIEGRTVIPNKRDNPFLHGVENVTGSCYWSCNLAVKRDRFLEIGGFNEAYLQAGGEDMEFAWRFKQLGLKAIFESQALVFHPQRTYSVKSFLKRVTLLRWSLLYFQQTGQSLGKSSSHWEIAAQVIYRHITALTRQSWHCITGKNQEGWRTRWFNSLWGWLVLPYQLPYLLWWEFKFRQKSDQVNTFKLR